MNDNKFFYQMVVRFPNKDERLFYWIRNEKIPYSNNKELMMFVKDNCTYFNRYKSVKLIRSIEVTQEQFESLDNWYIANSKKRDYTVIRDK